MITSYTKYFTSVLPVLDESLRGMEWLYSSKLFLCVLLFLVAETKIFFTNEELGNTFNMFDLSKVIN